MGREATKELPGAPRMRALAPIKTGAIILGASAGLALVLFLLVMAVFPPGIEVNPEDGASEISPDSQFIKVDTSRWGASVTSVQVKEAIIAPDGARENERLLDGHVQEGRFVLGDGSNPLKPDAEYTVSVAGTVKEFGLSGVHDSLFEETHTFSTITTPMPIIPKDGVKVKYGEEVTLEWNIPVDGFEYRLEGIQSTMRLEEEGRVAKITLAKFEQGKEYPLQITSATSSNGRDMKTPVVSAVKTAAPLVATFDPPDGATGTSVDAHPTIVFSEPVSNPGQAESIVSVEPKVEGAFKWTDPARLEFIPAASWDHLQDVTATIKGGPQYLRGIGGGFVESDIASTFTTAPAKSIDIDVTNQRLTLLENGNLVETIAVSTGAVGLETPLGDYTIYAKLTATDMRGPGYFAPHVPWVMVFQGDYTIHGNYWTTSFGVRGSGGSHGCVGMPVETAHRVFDWTPIGTPVHIHE